MKPTFLLLLLCFLCSFCGYRNCRAAAPTNFLVIMADDCTHNDLPVYGGANAKTPHLDRFASQSLVFNRAYLGEAMCQPCRAELYSGLYPVRNGCAWNHSASKPDTTSMPQHLGKLGYRVGLAGKVHVAPQKAFPFETIDGFDKSCTRNPTTEMDLANFRAFIADESAPFCAVVALVDPHVPWVMGDPSQYPPKKIILPPNLADTPRTREDYGRYLAEITYMDGQVGAIMKALDESGRAGDTLVLFTSEQGSQFPGCKWTNWDTGLHTALIARWPDRIPAGSRTDAIVQYADILPTFLDLAGAPPADGTFDGSSFKAVLLDGAAKHRAFAYGIHNNIPEGPAYPIRSVTDGEYRYIRNLTPDEIYIEKHLMGWSGDGQLNNPYWATWVSDAWDQPETYGLVKRYMHRPAEQLYHTRADAYELDDLAANPEFAARKAALSAELDRWMVEQHDPGAALDTQEAHAASKTLARIPPKKPGPKKK